MDKREKKSVEYPGAFYHVTSRGRLKRGRGLPSANTSFRNALIPVWLVVIVLMTAAYGNSKTLTANDKSPHPTAAPSTSALGAASARRPDDPLLSRYLRFIRITAQDGLSKTDIKGTGLGMDRKTYDPNDIELDICSKLGEIII